MPDNHGFPTDRAALTGRLFPDGIPELWSPTLVFYDENGAIDAARQAAHLAFMAPHVKGLLVPGSTGDAWEMSDEEALAALDAAIPFAAEQGVHLLAGALRPTPEATLALIGKILDHLRRRTGRDTAADAFAAARVRGVTIAAPTSAQPLSQDAIRDALEPDPLARPAVRRLPAAAGHREHDGARARGGTRRAPPQLPPVQGQRRPRRGGALRPDAARRLPHARGRGRLRPLGQGQRRPLRRFPAQQRQRLPVPARDGPRPPPPRADPRRPAAAPPRSRPPSPTRSPPSPSCATATPSPTPTRPWPTPWPGAATPPTPRRRGSTPAPACRARCSTPWRSRWSGTG